MREAVSVILCFENELFTIKRNCKLKAFPGYTAFIGGKVDEEDRVATCSNPLFSSIDNRLANTVIRESYEELNLEFKPSNTKSVSYVGEASSPDFNPIRFKTFFFLVELKSKVSFILEKKEIESAKWATAPEILSEWEQGQSLLVTPIKNFVEEFAQSRLNGKELSFDKRFNLAREVPYIETICDLFQFMPLSNTLPPADRTNAFVIKGDINILIDPSPKSLDEMEKLLYSIDKQNLKVDRIYLSHYHADHYQFTDTIASRLKIPVFMSKATNELIEKREGSSYFSGIKTCVVSEKETVCVWKNSDVRAYFIEGHARGHIGFAPDSKEWFIVGDLFQGVGSVVVGGENADMAIYFESLESVISFAPNCVIPSHGIALGGTEIINKNLRHRKMREEQIFKLMKAHKEAKVTIGLEDYIYEKVYGSLELNLKPYAMANIEAHMIKILNTH